jgi:hypothetical protein
MNDQGQQVFDRAAIVGAVNRLAEDDLRFLNHLIVERLKLMAQARSTRMMANFTRGDRVRFVSPHGEVIEGTVVRHNKKTVSILSATHGPWNVAPSLLQRVG